MQGYQNEPKEKIMPYDAQGRWIEENEWEQMMREQAAQRVQAFSRYYDAPPSLYPNQAAPYGSFPYADPTPAIWDTSPERVRQDIEPQYRRSWMFNQEPIADTSAISDIPFVAGILRGPGTRKGKRVAMTPDQIAARDANRQRVADEQLKREIQRIDKIDKAANPVQNKSSASAVRRGDTSLQQADDVRRKAQAAIEKQTRVGGAKLPGVVALADVVGDLTRPKGEKQTGIGYLGEQLMDTLESGRQRAAEVAEMEPYTGMGDAPDLVSTGHPGMLGAAGYDLSDPTGGLSAADANAAAYMAALSGDQADMLEEGGLLGGGIPSGRTFGVPTSDGDDGTSANTAVGIGQGLGNRFVNQRPFGGVHLGSKLADEPFDSSFSKSYDNTPKGRFWADTTPDHLSRVTRHGAISTPLSFPGTVTGTPPGVQRANLLGRIYGNAYTNNPVAALAGSRLAMTEDAANAAMKLAQAGGTTSLQSKTGAALRGLIRSLSTPAAIGLNLGLYSPNAGDPFLDTLGYAEKYAADQQAQFDEARLSELQALDALNEAHAQSVLASDVTQQPAYTGGDPTIPGLNVSSALADPNISAQDTINDYNAQIQAAFQSALTNPDPNVFGTGTQVASLGSVPAQVAAPVSAPVQQDVINAQMVQEVADRQRQEQAAVDAHVAASAMAPRQDAMPAAPAGPTQAEIEAQIAAAEKAHRDQQASARQALKDFMASRAYQQEGASIPAGLIDVATQVDSFANIAEAGSGYQGGYEGMSGFEGYR